MSTFCKRALFPALACLLAMAACGCNTREATTRGDVPASRIGTTQGTSTRPAATIPSTLFAAPSRHSHDVTTATLVERHPVRHSI